MKHRLFVTFLLAVSLLPLGAAPVLAHDPAAGAGSQPGAIPTPATAFEPFAPLVAPTPGERACVFSFYQNWLNGSLAKSMRYGQYARY